MAGVFLSYSSEDRERVALVAEGLRAEGFEVWWDREIPVAVTYEEYILQQLDSAGAVVVVWSPASVASRYVRWEAQRAERRRGVVVPVLIEEVDLPPEYFLIQAAVLTRWSGDRGDRDWRRLVAALVRLVGEPVGPEPVEQQAAARAVEKAPTSVPPPAEASEAAIATTEPSVPKPAPVVEEVGVPLALTEEGPSTVELEPVPEEAIPVPRAAEEALAAAVEGEPTPMGEEAGEQDAALAEAEVAESPRVWEPAAEAAMLVRESVVWEPVSLERAETEVAGVAVSAAEERRVLPWYRRPLVLVGAGFLLLAGVAVPLVLALSGGGEEAITTVAASTTEAGSTTSAASTATTTTAAPTTTVAAAGMAWDRILHDEAVFGGAGDQVMLAVSGWRGGLVAVGYDDSGGDWDGAAWTSPDGLHWTRVSHDEEVFGGSGDQGMKAVTAGGPGLVAVGADGGGGWYGDAVAAVWTSADGLTWERVPHDEAVFGGTQVAMWGVVAGGPGLVAVGWDYSASVNGSAAVWVSADGLAWERVPHDEAALGGVFNQEMRAVALGGPGLVAVGVDHAALSESEHAAVWVSADGLTWERIPHDEAVFNGPPMRGVTTGDAGLVAVGGEDVWTSADGLTWEQLPHDDEVFGGRDIDAVVADGPGFVAVGTGAWSSSDGAIWAVVGDPQVSGGSLSGVTAFGSGLVAVGRDDSGGDADAAVWASPPPGGFSATTMPTIVTTTTVGTSTTHAPTTSTSAVSTSTTQPPTTTTTATTTTPLSLSVEVTPSVLTAAPSGEYPYSFSVSVLVYGCTAGQIQFFDAAGGYEGGDLAVCPMDYAAVFGWRWSEHSSYFGTWTVQFVDDTGQQVSTSFTVLEP